MAAQPINGRGLREKINLNSLSLNTPHTFTLEGDGGVETPGTWGTQYRYAWDGNRISFVDPAVHELIQAQGAHAGDSIRFWRMETRNGSRKGPVQYRIELVNTADGSDDGTGIPNDPIPPGRRTLAPETKANDRTPAWVQPKQAEPASQPAPLASAPQTLPRVEQATETTSTVQQREAARLSACLAAAIDATATAESYAEAHGRRVTFTSEDLRALAITSYINATGGKR
jgi:hypothetical protein